jgi:hypothetical protein
VGKSDSGSGNGTLSPLAKGIGQLVLLVLIALVFWAGSTIYSNSLRLAIIETKMEIVLDRE